jgi:hypothetical protein
MAEFIPEAALSASPEANQPWVVPEACQGMYPCEGNFDENGMWVCIDPVHAQVDSDLTYTGNY